MGETIFFSIIVPVYNTEDYIEKCITSLLRQDISDYEIIIVNDASTDNSVNIVKRLINNNTNLRLICKPVNSGLSDTRNVGIKEAKGKYLLFVDSDDYLEENILRDLKNDIVNSKADITYFGYYVDKCKKNSEVVFTYVGKPGVYNKNDFMEKELSRGNLSIPACMGCYSKQLLIDNNLLFEPGILHEDVRWSPMILNMSEIVMANERIIYHYVIRNNSISHKKENRLKNGRDLIDTCLVLLHYSKTIEGNHLRKLFQNYIVTTYLKAVAVNDLYKNTDLVNRFFPISYAYRIKDVFRSIIFMISPRLYSAIYNAFKRLQNPNVT